MQQLTLENFRVFGTKATFDLAPVTVLTGKNNSGKSSLIKALLVLADYLQEQDDHTVLRLDGPRAGKHKITSFKSLCNWNLEKDARVCFGYESEGMLFEYEFIQHEDPTRATLSFFRATLLAAKEVLTLKYQGWKQTAAQMPLAEITVDDTSHIESSQSPSYSLSVRQHFIDLITNSAQRREEFNQQQQAISKSLADVEQKLADLQKRKQQPLAQKMQPLLEKQRQEYSDKIEQMQAASTESDAEFNLDVFVNEGHLAGRNIVSLVLHALQSQGQESQSMETTGVFHTSAPAVHVMWRQALLRFGQIMQQRMQFALFHVGANRTFQAPLIFNQQQGSELASIVAPVLGTGFVKGGRAERFLNHWLRFFEIGEAIKIERVEGVAFKVLVKQKNWINLVDLGYGAGQLITVLLQIASILQQWELGRSTDRVIVTGPVTVLVEEPESNLHPRLQSLLAELFAKPEPYLAIRHPEPGSRRARLGQALPFQFVLETHSEYFIRKMQLLIARGELATSDAVVHYMDTEGNRRITIGGDGKLSQQFGSGFFDEAGEEALALLRLQREKQQLKPAV